MKFDEILQRYEDSLMAYNRAAGLMDKGRLDEAEELLKAALSRYPREVFMDEEQELDASMLDSIDTLFTNISDRLELVRSIKSGPKLGSAGILTLRDLVERNALKTKSEPMPKSVAQDSFSTDASVELDYTASKLGEEEFERVWDDDSKSGEEDSGAADVSATAELSAEDIILSGLTDVRAEDVEAAVEASAPEPQEKNPPEIDEALAAIEAFEEMDAGSGGQTEKGEFDNIEIDIDIEMERVADAESDAASINAEKEKSLEDMLAGTLTDAPPPEDIELIDEEPHSSHIPETAPAPDEEKVKKALEAVAAAADDHTDETTEESTPEAAEAGADEAEADGGAATEKKKPGIFSKLSALKKPKKTKINEPQEAELLEMSDEGPANAPEAPPEKTDEEAGGPKKMKKLKLFGIGKKKKSSGEELNDMTEQTAEIATEELAAEAESVAEAAQEEPVVEVSAAFSTTPATPANMSDDEKDEEDEALLSRDEIKKQYGPAHKHTIIERTTVNVSGIFSSIFVVLMLLAGFADLGYRIYTDVYLGGLDSLYRGGEKAALSEPTKMDEALTNYLQYRAALPDMDADKNKISAYLPVAWSSKLRNEKNKPDDALMLMRLMRREDVRAAALDEEFVSALIMKAEQGVSGGEEEFKETTSRARQILAEGRVAEPVALEMLNKLDALEAGAVAVKASGK